MAEIKCAKGHSYDPDQYAACPYCNNAQQQVFFETPVVAQNATAPLGGVQQHNASITSPLISPEAERSATGINKTRPLFAPAAAAEEKKVTDKQRTVGYMEEKLGLNPVVGWLVCIDGKAKGKDYKLYGHINTVGRSSKMDVALTEDKMISDENHARISYSEKNNKFFIAPADGKNLFYVNGDEILVPTQLNAYDVVDFGETTLIFVPLCSDRFIWQKEDAE